MKFQVNRDVLSEAVSFAVRLLPQRTTTPVLGGILIEADANTVRLSVFDHEVSAQVEIIAQVETSGRTLVPGRLLSDIATKLPNAPVEFKLEGTKVHVACGTTKFALPIMDVAAYPTLPEIPVVSGVVVGDVLATAINQAAAAAMKDDVQPIYTAIQIETTGDELSLLATDKYRMALVEVAWKANPGAEGASVLVPSKTLQEVAKTFANQGDVSLSIINNEERQMVAFQANNRSVTALLIKGNYPPIKTMFSTEVENYSVVSKQDLLESTRRVMLVVQRDHPIKYTFGESTISLESIGNEVAEASESISAELNGEENTLSLKPQYLIDGLAGVHTEFVKIGFTRNHENPNKPSPVLITSHSAKEKSDADNYRYLLQPNLLVR
ncbi:MAG: DNA polymerase III subunit beta [Rhodoluna sp.]|nr:DNA polymerase III subunit beta [Rhodoluna sp.]